ncbi:MAG TPA: TIR domain-containing protein [Rubrivivax sp.]|nr:TIR domain-containing protein [Rubrivivax sp.]
MTSRPSIPFLLELLRLAMRKEATALYVVPWMPPTLRIGERSVALSSTSFSPEQSTRLVLDLLDAEHRAALDRSREIEFGFALEGVGRFRVHAFRRHGQPAMTIRPFATGTPTPRTLALATPACRAVLAEHGLFLIASHSPTLRKDAAAALLEHRNRVGEGALLLLDGASRFWHESARCRVRQGLDAADIDAALRQRAQAPGVRTPLAIAWGELCDSLRLQQAVQAAEQALCVLTVDAARPLLALQALASLARGHDDPQLLRRAALRLHAVLVLRPVPARSGGQDLAACELLANSPALAAELAEGDFDALHRLLQQDPWPAAPGSSCAVPDEHLLELVAEDRVTPNMALKCAHDPATFERELARRLVTGAQSAPTKARVDTGFADLFPSGAVPLDPFDFAEPTTIAPPPETVIDEVTWYDGYDDARAARLPPLVPLASQTCSPRSLKAQVWTAPAVAPGAVARIDVWLARAAQTAEVARAAAEDEGGSADEGVIEDELPPVAVQLRIEDVLRAPVAQRIVWTEQPRRVRFEIAVPPHLASGPRAAELRLSIHGLLIGELGFVLGVRPGAGGATPPEETHTVRRMLHFAYAAFADTDRAAVEELLQPLAELAPDLQVHRGSAARGAGPDWRERIECEIGQRERMFLFWSRAAADSPWVDFEWRYLLRSRGPSALDIVLLEPPRLAPLPPELAGLPVSLMRRTGTPPE